MGLGLGCNVSKSSQKRIKRLAPVRRWTIVLAVTAIVAANGVGVGVRAADDIGVNLQGRWRENQYKRTGLYDFLYYIGCSLNVKMFRKPSHSLFEKM